ncbi:MAG: branched-chain amino acid ABC transporter permease [candidate division FCPU426 bacterium]
MNTLLQLLLDGLSLGAIYALIALGYTLVYGILRLINFAHGDIFMVAAYAALFSALSSLAPADPGATRFAVTLLASMAAAALLGLAIERFCYRPLRGQPRINLLITAVGVSLLLENLSQVLFGANPRVFPELLQGGVAFENGQLKVGQIDVWVLLTAFGLMLALEAFVHRTRAGRAMRAVAHSHETAALVGVPVDKVIALTFAVGSALAAAAAVLYGVKYPQVSPFMGVMPGLKAFVAAVLGGIGNLRGAVLGALLLGLAESLVIGYGGATWKDALAFLILILILVLRPAGLLGKYEAEKV